MLDFVKNFFFFFFCGHHVKYAFVFCETHTIINKDLYAAISYDVVHNMHEKSKSSDEVRNGKVISTIPWPFKTTKKYYNLKIRECLLEN